MKMDRDTDMLVLGQGLVFLRHRLKWKPVRLQEPLREDDPRKRDWKAPHSEVAVGRQDELRSRGGA